MTRTALAGCLAFMCCALAAAPAHAQGLPGEPFAPGEVVVRFKPSAGATERRDVRRENDATVADVLTLPGVQVLEIDDGRSVPAAAAALGREDEVAYAEPNWIYELDAIPVDPRFGELWGLHNTGQVVDGQAGAPDADIDAPEAWDVTTGSPEVVVAVVDSGIEHRHPDIAPNMWANPGETDNGVDDDGNGFIDDVRGWDFYGDAIRRNALGDNEPLDFNGHGTHVAGTIAATRDDTTPDRAVTGVAPSSKVMALRTCNGGGECSSSAIAEAFDYAGDEGAAVVNASLGGPNGSDATLQAIRAHPETLYVAAAGNDRENLDLQGRSQFPCELDAPNMVCVAASDEDDDLATAFSNFGPTAVDLAAPGTSILSARPAWDDITPAVETFDDATRFNDEWTTLTASGESWGLVTSPRFSLADSPSGTYDPDSLAAVTRDPVSLAGRSACGINFIHRFDTADALGDFVAVRGSDTGAADDFETLDVVFEDTDGDFTSTRVDASRFDGVPSFHPRFHFQSDGDATVGDGIYLDNFQVRCLSSVFGTGQFDFLDGTSFAAPHVSGAAALARARHPEASADQLRRLLIETVDRNPDLANRSVSGGRLNARSAVTAPLPPVPGGSPSGGSGEPPSAEPPSPSDPGPAPAGPPADRITLAATRIRLTRTGLAAMPVECRSSRSSCLGRIVIRTAHRVRARSAGRSRRLRLGRRNFSIPGTGTRRVVKVRISRKGRRLLARKRRLRVRVALSLREGAAVAAPELSTVVLLAPRR